MYLSRLILNPRNPKVRRDIANLHDIHRTILRAFPQEETPTNFREKHGVLFRVDIDSDNAVPTILVQSTTAPDWDFLNDFTGYLNNAETSNPSVKNIQNNLNSLKVGQILRFKLRANVTLKTKTYSNGQKGTPHRVPLRTEAEQINWLIRKGRLHGFSLCMASDNGHAEPIVQVIPSEDVIARKDSTTTKMTFSSVLYQGRLSITDCPEFLNTMSKGVGSAKAYGFGLLSIAPG